MKRLLVVGAVLAVIMALAPPAWAGDTICTGTLTGVHDNVVVPPGADCVLAGAQVKGDVKILSEGSLFSIASGPRTTRIGGDVQGDNVDFALLFFQTQVRGDFQIKGSNAGTTSGHDIFTIIGGDTQLEGNAGTLFVDAASIGGDLEVTKNTGRLEIEFNTVGGNVKIEENVVPPSAMSVIFNQVTGNMGVFKNTGPGFKQVAENTVGGNLQCFENTSPFVGGPNTAGKAEGQCF